jgi:hypothetical protein
MSSKSTDRAKVGLSIQPPGGNGACICICGRASTHKTDEKRQVVARRDHKNNEFVSLSLGAPVGASTNRHKHKQIRYD